MKVIRRSALVLLFLVTCVSLSSGIYHQRGLAPGRPAMDLIPPLATQSPRLRFHLGEVHNNQPKISPILPAMPFPPSPWYVAQWQQPSVVVPTFGGRVDHLPDDSRLGKAKYAFTAQDGHASVRIFGHDNNWVYELQQSGGVLTEGGGSNLFLSVDANSGAQFDRRMTYDVDVKLSRALVRYDTQNALADGAVLSMAFSGIGLLFEAAGERPQFVFLQMGITSSRPVPRQAAYLCSIVKGEPQLLYSPSRGPKEELLPYRADSGDLHHFHYELTDYLVELISNSYQCGGSRFEWSSAARDVRHWRLTGFYVGLETEVEDHRAGARTRAPQGVVDTSLQIANARIAHASP